MHPFHAMLLLFALFGLLAFAFVMRWERRYFQRCGKAGAWLMVRLATIPIALVTAALVIIPARTTSGMEGLAVAYLMLLAVAPIFWFGAHWMVGRLARPRLTFGESALIAGSPIVFGLALSAVAHALQPIAWSWLRSAVGKQGTDYGIHEDKPQAALACLTPTTGQCCSGCHRS